MRGYRFNPFRTRAEYAYTRYHQYFYGRVADIGAGASPSYFSKTGLDYTSVDVSSSRSKPDIVFEFEREGIPLNTKEFDTVLCMDVLEHTDDPYALFSELCRVTSRYIIISLPNNWVGYFAHFMRGRNRTLGYGLPEERPPSGVRHKWYFNAEDAERFLRYNAKKNGFLVRKLDFIFDPQNNLMNFLWFPRINYLTDERIKEIISDEDYRQKIGRMAQVVSLSINILGRKQTFFLIKAFKIVFRTPVALVDELLKAVFWGWGSKYRYLNLFCRQVWVVLERAEDQIVR